MAFRLMNVFIGDNSLAPITNGLSDLHLGDWAKQRKYNPDYMATLNSISIIWQALPHNIRVIMWVINWESKLTQLKNNAESFGVQIYICIIYWVLLWTYPAIDNIEVLLIWL